MLDENERHYNGELNLSGEQLLHFFEHELGMSPPSVCYDKDGKWDCQKQIAHIHMDKDVDYWEKEDA